MGRVPPSSTSTWLLLGVSVIVLPHTIYLHISCDTGGYAFITNMIPLHALVLLLMGRYTNRLYIGYSTWYAIGTLASMQVPFVGFQPVRTSEHMAALGKFIILEPLYSLLSLPLSGVFGLLQLVAFTDLVRSHVSSKQFQTLLRVSVVVIGLLGAATIGLLTMKGWIAPWTGRFYSLWDTGYAKK